MPILNMMSTPTKTEIHPVTLIERVDKSLLLQVGNQVMVLDDAAARSMRLLLDLQFDMKAKDS